MRLRVCLDAPREAGSLFLALCGGKQLFFCFFFENLAEVHSSTLGGEGDEKLTDEADASCGPILAVFLTLFFPTTLSPPTYPLIYKTLRLDENLTVRGESASVEREGNNVFALC